MTKDTTKEAAVAAEVLLFDDWFDAIEDGVRGSRSRLYRGAAGGGTFARRLSRPRYGRRKPGEDEAAMPVVGRAPRASRADADGDVRQDADRRAARSADGRGRQDARMAERFASRLSAPHPGRRRLDRRRLSFGNQHAPGAAGVERGVRRAGRQGRGQPGLAQGEGRLGRLERAFARRGADRPADPRRHGGARSARQEGDLDLAAGRARRARGRPEGAARDQEHGRRERGGLARAARRSRRARIADAGVGRRRRRAGPGKGAGGAVARHGRPALHGAQASQSARPCARAAARGNLERLQRYDLRRDRSRRSKPGARPSSANGGSNAAPSPTAWRKPATSSSPSRASRRANGSRSEPRTRSSDCTRSSSAGSRPRPSCPAPRPPPCCSGRCSPRGRSPCARSTDGRASPRSPTDQIIDLAA